ncbi:MAG TPA: hypothetical protein VGP48_01310 [Stellaceae bacterium]|jgi:hypothetical protein|nr:hypothetical protein [Stellaceae bacterium]
MSRFVILLATLATLLSACASTDPRNSDCVRQGQGSSMRWGYYPGYGCGPVPRALTNFS